MSSTKLSMLLFGVFLLAAITIEAFNVCSTDFINGGCLPLEFGSDPAPDGQGCSVKPNPTIRWDNNGTTGVQSFVVVIDDPTNNNYWIHWAVKDIPINIKELPRASSKTATIPGVELSGSFTFGYAAPCGGDANTYRVRVYAMAVPVSSVFVVEGVQTMRGNEIGDALAKEGVISIAETTWTYYRMQPAFCPLTPVSCSCGIELLCLNTTQPTSPIPTTPQASSSPSNTNDNNNIPSTSKSQSTPTSSTSEVNQPTEVIHVEDINSAGSAVVEKAIVFLVLVGALFI